VREYQRFISTNLLDANLNLKPGCEILPSSNDSPRGSSKDSAKGSQKPSGVDEDKTDEDKTGKEKNKSDEDEAKQDEAEAKRGHPVPSPSFSDLPSGVSSVRKALAGTVPKNRPKGHADRALDILRETKASIRLDPKAVAKAQRFLLRIDFDNGGEDAIDRLLQAAKGNGVDNPAGYFLSGLQQVAQEHPL